MRTFLLFLIIQITFLSCREKETDHSAHQQQKDHGNMISLTERQMDLANIKLDTARVKDLPLSSGIIAVAAINEKEIFTHSSKVEGRIEKLFVRTTGEFINTGEPLYEIYSEQLIADQKDFLLAVQQQKHSKEWSHTIGMIKDAASKKLRAWSFSEKQIAQIENTEKIFPYATYYSEESGYVTELLVSEGQYVNIGSPVINLSRLKSIWVEAHLDIDDQKVIQQEKVLNVVFDNIPGRIFKGEIDVENPSLEKNQKIALVRIRIDNKDNLIKPGMHATVHISQKAEKKLVIPKSALLIEKMTMVWILNSHGMFEPRRVQTGVQSKTDVEIISGLKNGDLVVSSGVFLLKSEFLLRKGGGGGHAGH